MFVADTKNPVITDKRMSFFAVEQSASGGISRFCPGADWAEPDGPRPDSTRWRILSFLSVFFQYRAENFIRHGSLRKIYIRDLSVPDTPPEYRYICGIPRSNHPTHFEKAGIFPPNQQDL